MSVRSPIVMRPRTELAIAAGILALLVVIGAATGRLLRTNDDPDPRASSFSAARGGIRGAAEALERIGVDVTRWRERPRALTGRVGGDGSAFALIAPSSSPTPDEWQAILTLANDAGGSDLVLAGDATAPLARCFGYTIVSSVFDSALVAPPGSDARKGDTWVHAHLVPVTTADRTRPARSRFGGDEGFTCRPLPLARVDTLLVTGAGKLAMARLHRAGLDRRILLVADAALLRNRVMRESATAPLVLDALAGRSRRVVFDEYHHGFGAGGSMIAVLLSWSARNPFGWMAWQLAAVGLIALLTGVVRFGPVRAGIPRARRSPLEHVRALATALSAARGHEVAIGAIVRGLRRRLSPAGSPRAEPRARDDWRPWLDSLVTHAPTPRARQSAEALRRAADSPEPDSAVLAAANAVEDLWKDVRP